MQDNNKNNYKSRTQEFSVNGWQFQDEFKREPFVLRLPRNEAIAVCRVAFADGKPVPENARGRGTYCLPKYTAGA
jgi:hypothetical protein